MNLSFVQRLEAMLFHYSDDIDRTPIHNTSTLIKEYVKLANDKSTQSLYVFYGILNNSRNVRDMGY